MKEIKRVRVHQSSLVLATMAMLISLIFVVPFVLWTMFFTEAKPRLDSLIFLLLPLLYFVFTYIVYALAFFFYNLAAKLVGGIEVETE